MERVNRVNREEWGEEVLLKVESDGWTKEKSLGTFSEHLSLPSIAMMFCLVAFRDAF